MNNRVKYIICQYDDIMAFVKNKLVFSDITEYRSLPVYFIVGQPELEIEIVTSSISPDISYIYFGKGCSNEFFNTIYFDEFLELLNHDALQYFIFNIDLFASRNNQS